MRNVTQALLLFDDEMVLKSDDEEVFAAREYMDEDTQANTEVQSPPPNTDKPESSPVQETDESTFDSSLDLKKFDNILPLTKRQQVKYLKKVSRILFNRLTEAQWAQHKEVVVSYANLKAAIEGYYEENINHKEQTNKVIDAAMNSLDKNSIARGDLLNALNRVTEALKAILRNILVVQEEAEKIGLDPKKIISAKAGEKFKKAHDAKHQVLKKEHSQKAKRAMELRMKKVEQYMWTMSNRLKLEPIIDVKIHPNTRLALPTVYKNNDKRNFESPRQAVSLSSGRKWKHMELELKIKVPRLECNRSLPDGISIVNNMVIEEPEYGIFFTDVFGDQAFKRWNDIHKVRVDSLVSYLVMALLVKTQENARFGLKLRKLIAEHPDQEKLQSKKVKLEALGYKLD
nr:hypothetical protein [Tanacetum cinerariifolium]